MKCDGVQRKLSAYLDGELGDLDASALRGHLRTCEACRALADRESKMVLALRELPALDPPPALWHAIRDRLAEQEIADASAPWRVRLWQRLSPWMPQLGMGAAAAAAAVALLWWRAAPEPLAPRDGAPGGAAQTVVAAPDLAAEAQPVVDVATALADEAAFAEASYDKAVAELDAMIATERASWAPGYARDFDERVASLRAELGPLPAGPERERAWQKLVRYLQTTLTRAELAMGAP